MSLERLVILGLLVALVLLGWLLVRLWRAARLRRLRAVDRPLAAVAPLGRPAVVAFTSPTCAECHTRQAPALARLAAEIGDAATIRTVSALEQQSLADHVGILTVPATVVVDAGGRVCHLNLGYASTATLRAQVASVGAPAS
jgi:thiol-disulfide isomerase/thioredoxin